MQKNLNLLWTNSKKCSIIIQYLKFGLYLSGRKTPAIIISIIGGIKMKHFSKLTAAAAAVILAATSAGCSAPSAINIGSGTKNAVKIDGAEIRAGVFIYNELQAYNEAAMKIYQESGAYPTADDIQDAKIEDLDSEDWIQNKATDYCKQFVAVNREFDKVGGELTADELKEIDEAVESAKDQAIFKDNGVGEQSIREMYTNSSKQTYLFKHYYGIDSEFGCSEDDLKKYYEDNIARVKYLNISLKDSEGKKLEGDALKEVNDLVDKYVKEINSESTNEARFKKFDEVKKEYEEYTQKKQEEEAAAQAAANGETTTSAETTTTVTTTPDPNETTTTTTTNPFENEVTLAKLTETTAPVGEAVEVTTAPEDESQAANKKFNNKVFNELTLYKAEKYDYDDTTVYIVIKGDIKERMNKDDIWTDETIENTLANRYSQDFLDMIKSLYETYSVDKNKRAYKRYAPFKLDLDNI